jgi:hypothetical protein
MLCIAVTGDTASPHVLAEGVAMAPRLSPDLFDH